MNRTPETDADSTEREPASPSRTAETTEQTIEEAEAAKEPGVEEGEANTPTPPAPAPSTDARAAQRGVARSSGIVSLAVLGSRVLGLVRDQVFAAFFGADFHYDTFKIGFLIPNTLRDLFAEGALSG